MTWVKKEINDFAVLIKSVPLLHNLKKNWNKLRLLIVIWVVVVTICCLNIWIFTPLQLNAHLLSSSTYTGMNYSLKPACSIKCCTILQASLEQVNNFQSSISLFFIHMISTLPKPPSLIDMNINFCRWTLFMLFLFWMRNPRQTACL